MIDSERRPGSMQLVEPLNLAITRAQLILFRPLDLRRWFALGLIIFLAMLTRTGGFGSNIGFSWPFSSSPGGLGQSLRHGTQNGAAMIQANWVLSLILGSAALVAGTALAILFLWLSSRGQMMLIRAVASNDTGIRANWAATAREGHSLFLFRLAIWFIAAAASLVLILIGAIGAFLHSKMLLALLVPLLLLFFLLVLSYAIVEFLVAAFVAPLMLHLRVGCIEGWRAFRPILAANLGIVLLIFVVRIAYFFAFGIVSTLATCCTCCIAALPLLHQTVFAPFYVFDRAFTLYALSSSGAEYQVIRPEPPFEEAPPAGHDDPS